MPDVLNGSIVSGLIDHNTGMWDLAIIQDIFTTADIDRILSVPISPHHEDSWYWYGDPKGCYTVKEGYRRIIGDVVNPPGTYDRWLHLWKVKCPAKWKIFVWRALSNILPTTTNLILKRVEIDPTCPMCGIYHENVMHSLVLCEYSRLIWHESSLHVPSVIDDDFNVWFRNAISVLNKEDIFVMLAVLYHIWRARNHAVWDAFLPVPARVWWMANLAAAAWKQVHGTQQPQQHVAHEAVAASAQIGSPICHFDAGYYPRTKSATVRAVLTTQIGDFIAAFNARLPPCFSPLMAESLACKEALSWIKDRGLAAITMYTDCSVLKDLLVSSSSELFSYVSYSVDAIKALMSSLLSCSVVLIPRTQNQGAHTLATVAFSQEAPIVQLAFWQGVALCLKVFTPLVNVLYIVDHDKKSSMGFVYGDELM
ncbi:uncharacterized protein LOC115999311 [Ipomoea triloba]|uniref:uncharacterized protein LOC115999311 n=1 Tax=Ipomoea triloba TaxID=35885 RepID=UPI00125DD520|nr:uncharacterized protein LOC115999311 [Ipomoea triloba]